MEHESVFMVLGQLSHTLSIISLEKLIHQKVSSMRTGIFVYFVCCFIPSPQKNAWHIEVLQRYQMNEGMPFQKIIPDSCFLQNFQRILYSLSPVIQQKRGKNTILEAAHIFVGGLLKSIGHVGQPYTNQNIPLKSLLEQDREYINTV